MDILLAVLQMLFTFLNDNLDQMDNLRARRDLDDPVIIPPIVHEPPVIDDEIVKSNTPFIDDILKSRETPGLTTTGHELNINLYSEPFCGTGFYKIPGTVKDVILTISLLINMCQLIVRIKKAIALRRRRRQAAENHPINRPILGQLGKFPI